MARRARFDEPNYFYHITCRGQRKNPLFFSDDDFNAYYGIINKVSMDMDIEIYGYCLMRNHIHLLLRRRENSLEHFFRLVNTRYAMYFNKKYDLVGRVFQGRFKSSTVLDEQYLFFILHYIHNNPVKAELVEHPEDYPQSSSSFYNKKGKTRISKLRRLEGYLKSSSDDTFPVSEDFIGSADELLLTDKRRKGREMSKYAERRYLSGLNAEKLLNKYLSKVNISKSNLLSKLYDGEMIGHRRKIVMHLHKSSISNAAIARVMNRSRSWVSKLKKKLKL